MHEGMPETLLARAQRGEAQACVQLGRACAANRDYGSALQWFALGARSGDADALAEVGFLHTRGLVDAADPAFGVQRLQLAAASGHADAALQLAKLMLEGRWLPFDLPQLQDWIALALRRRLPELKHVAVMLGATSEAATLAALDAWFRPGPLATTVQRAAPLLAYIDDVLPESACRWLRGLAAPRMRPALVYEPRSGERVQDPTRSNSAAYLEVQFLATLLIEWRLLACADPQQALARSEPVSVLHYAVGQEYQAHRDYLNPTSQPDQFPPQGPGQRIRTVFAYLNDVEAGGQTTFPTLGHSITPSTGRVVVFDNLDANGRPDPSTLHASLPVTKGEKWLATLWLREGWAR